MIRLAAVLGACALAACSDVGPVSGTGPATGPGSEAALEFGGLRITRAELEDLIPYFESIDRRLGRQHTRRVVLEEDLIPMKLAQRELVAERRELRERAEALRRVIGNGGFPDLVARGQRFGATRPDQFWLRQQLPHAVARYAFDESSLGQVSPVIEVPQGFALVATSEIQRGTTMILDRADACLVTFYTHDAQAFGRWLEGALPKLHKTLTWVSPEFAAIVPNYLRP